MTTKTLRFNTGRKYTANGQRITATLHDDGIVTFHDHDRMIDGEFKINNPAFFSEAVVLGRYDRNEYERSNRCWQDAMMAGGCNSTWED